MEAEEEADEAERLVSNDCKFADGAGVGGGEDAGAAAGGEGEIRGLRIVVQSAMGIFIYNSAVVFILLEFYTNSIIHPGSL